MLEFPLTYAGEQFGDLEPMTPPRPRHHRRLIALRILMIGVSVFMLFFFISQLSAQDDPGEIVITIPAKNMKDQQQDDHMRYIDRRVTALEIWHAQHDRDAKEIGIRRDGQINDVSQKITQIEGYGAGAFGVLTLFQLLGLRFQVKAGKQTA